MTEENNIKGNTAKFAIMDDGNKDLFHDLFYSPEAERVTLRELEQRTIHAENLAIKASNDAAVAAGEAERAGKELRLAEDYLRTCKSINDEIKRNTRQTNVYCCIAAIACLATVIVIALMYLWGR